MREGKIIPVVCAVLVDHEDRFLVVKRPHGGRLGGLWEFPGGKIESAESPESALHRELKEELDLDISCLGQHVSLRAVKHAYDFALIWLVPFLVRCGERPPLKLLEHTELRWIGFDGANDLAWAPADVPILGELRRCLSHSLADSSFWKND